MINRNVLLASKKLLSDMPIKNQEIIGNVKER
jgi:hypothetical protein